MAGFDRNIFDRQALDDAMTARAQTIGGGASTDTSVELHVSGMTAAW
jgi:hypothetical protein